ncbi:hypothetical protein K040078D81_37650 [Blautia hominis]|uniref:Uncharacterized protein n=1 Tax=Blautia hominis TaxID=2025493 RepID=A0ABQ0BDX7_9FIRM
MTDLFAGDIYLPSPRGYLGRRDFAGFGGFYRRAGGISGSSRKRNLQVHIDFSF